MKGSPYFDFLAICALLVLLSTEQAESGLVTTIPKSIYLNSTAKVCFSSLNITQGLMIQGRLLYNTAKCPPVFATPWESYKDRDGCIEFSTACPYREYRQRIGFPGSAVLTIMMYGRRGSEVIEKFFEKRIAVMPMTTETFIQSDKPIYQPGQTVLFRVLTVTYPGMLPDIEKPKDVWITSPSGTRMQQWRDQVSSDGLLDLTFELSEEPEMGEWTIHVQVHSGLGMQQTFKVEEYVLPKFEVLIHPPSYLYKFHDEPFTVRVCAKYTYGQPVSGHIAANITLKPFRPAYYGWWRRDEIQPDSVISLEMDADEITGCGDLNTQDGLLVSSDAVQRGWKKLTVVANFTERGTGVTLSAYSDDTPIARHRMNMNINGPNEFKPLLPYHGQVVVTKPDGSPVEMQRVKISWQFGSRQIVLTRADGTADFTLDTPYQSSVDKLTITAKLLHDDSANVREKRKEQKYVKAWYSPTGSFLQISDIKERISTGQSVPVHLEFTLPKNEIEIEFFYRVISVGRIIESGSHQWTMDDSQVTGSGEPPLETVLHASVSSQSRQRRSSPPFPHYLRFHEIVSPDLPDYATDGTTSQTTFYFDASIEMSPKSQILVYYIRTDGEVVSASTDFKMRPAFRNQVSLEFLEGREVSPGQTASISVTGQPSSLCAVGVVDKSVYIMGGNNQLSKEKVLQPLRSLNVISGSRNTSCPSEHSSDYSSRHADSLEGFRAAGVDVSTDLLVETRPCWQKRYLPCNVTIRGCDNRFSVSGGNVFLLHAFETKEIAPPMIVPLSRSFDVPQNSAPNIEVIQAEIEDTAPVTQLRSYFPETWLWKLNRLGENGQHVIEEEIPHTITDWVASAFCLSPDHGVGVADTTSIRAFQPFFLSYTIPYSIIRGEKAPVKVTIFNYLSSCLNIQLTMSESTAYNVESRPESETVEVCGNSAETLEYEILATELGDIPIRVSASAEPSTNRGDLPIDDITFPVTDTLEDTILVEPEGAEKEETFSELICPHDRNTTYQQTIPLLLPSLVVPGSARGRFQVIGDLMGPVMSNLDSLLRMPFGCGEQNMILMAPNIYVMQYLSFTNQLTPDIKEKALKFMERGYQRELRYQLSDHSYSAFGERDGEGSTWLTAFVLKCFSQAQDYMDIDQENLDRTRTWLNENPRDGNGCVVTRGRVIIKEMQGSVSSPVTMTAYVTIALLEAGASPYDSSVMQGLQCIENGILSEGENMNTYTLAISSYALGMGEHYTTQAAVIHTLKQRILRDGELSYWSKSQVAELCYGFCRADSSDVEITSYVLLALMHCNIPIVNMLHEVMPIIKWLNTQRNALGGFSSTQDTVLGLQALSQFAALVYDPDSPLSLNISVSATRTPPYVNQQHNFTVNAYNSLVLQREELEEVPTTLDLTATGTGCALVQAELMYNVPVTRPVHHFFNITTSIRDWETNSVNDPSACGDKILEICVRYTGSDVETGMATMEVKMVSGYVPHEQSLNEFQSLDGSSIGLKRFDKYKEGQTLSLYFDKFDAEVRCIPLHMKQEIFVKETKDAFIKVYDYYLPGVIGYKSYNTCETEM